MVTTIEFDNEDNPMTSAVKKPAGMRVIELEHGNRPFVQILADLYRQEKSQVAVAERLNIPLSSLRRYEERLGIETKRVLPDGSIIG